VHEQIVPILWEHPLLMSHVLMIVNIVQANLATTKAIRSAEFKSIMSTELLLKVKTIILHIIKALYTLSRFATF
jgi:hypothetical protein